MKKNRLNLYKRRKSRIKKFKIELIIDDTF